MMSPWTLIKIAVIGLVAVWLSFHPGQITMAWFGFVIETSALVLALIVLVLALVLSWLTGLWYRARLARQARRQRHQQQTFLRDLTLLSAGQTALPTRRKADPKLAALIQAQKAEGTEAIKTFEDLCQWEETRFMGLRGLIELAVQDSATERALSLCDEAAQLDQRSPWLARTRLRLLLDTARWDEAYKVAIDAVKLLPEGPQVVATVAIGRAWHLAKNDDLPAALQSARAALAQTPTFPPAIACLASLLVDNKQAKKAQRFLEKKYILAPHPDIARAYAHSRQPEKQEAQPVGQALARVRAFEHLHTLLPTYVPGKVLLAEAELAAEMAPAARGHLRLALAKRADQQILRLLAEVEDAQGNPEKASNYRNQAGLAPLPPAWVCSACQTPYLNWRESCTRCHQVACLAWQETPTAISVAQPFELIATGVGGSRKLAGILKSTSSDAT
ncbi:MAG: hypothetical protein AAF442_03015 [Pseudomonadota bacterium]